jgi:hypothetical protein
MPLTGVNIDRAQGALGLQEPLESGVSAIVTNGVAVSGGAQLDTIYKFLSLKDAEALGLTEKYDSDNSVLVWHQLSRYFYRTASPCYLLLVDQTLMMADMLNPSTTHAARLLQEAEGEVYQLAVCRNPDTSYSPTVSEGFDEDVFNAIDQAKALRDEVQAEKMPTMFWIEGRAWDGAPASMKDLRTSGQDELNAYNISVCILQDPDVADKDSAYPNYADVGSALGEESAVGISEHIGRVIDERDLSDPAKGYYTRLGFSGGNLFADFAEVDLKAMVEKGYVFARRYKRYAGVYFEQDPTATPVSSDYYNRRYCRVWNEAYTRLYLGLLGALKRKVPLEGGQIEPGARAFYEGEARTALAALQPEHINGLDVEIKPELVQDGATRKIQCEWFIYVYPTGDIIGGTLGLAV